MTQPTVGVGDLTFNNCVDMNKIDSEDNKGDFQELIENFLTTTGGDEWMIDKMIHWEIFYIKHI